MLGGNVQEVGSPRGFSSRGLLGKPTFPNPRGGACNQVSKDFKDFVTAIGECKSKQEEDRIIMKEMCAPIPILFALSALPGSSEAGECF